MPFPGCRRRGQHFRRRAQHRELGLSRPGLCLWGGCFVAKLDSSGNLLWNTFLGGSGTDYAYSVFIGADGYVYVAGSSDATWGSPIRSYAYLDDAFAAKLNGDGTLVWNTFLGASNSDYAYAIAADGNGNVTVAGQSYSTWGSPVRAYSAACDGFVAKLTPGRNGHLEHVPGRKRK